MHTIHLTKEHLQSYLRDLAARISKLEADSPQVWAMVGFSGCVLGRELAEVAPDLYASVDELIVSYNRRTDTVSFPGQEQFRDVISGRNVLLIDGTVHSGSTLLRVTKALEELEPRKISSYALVVRRGSQVIPNHFGFLIGDHDRVHFPAPRYSNNRLFPFGTYRRMCEEDCARPMIMTGADFIDKLHWEDRWYEVSTDPKRQIYIHEQNGSICGFVSFRLQENGGILLDEVGVDKSCHGQKLGAHLMRWAEHYARHENCSNIELWAVENRVKWYQGMEYLHAGEQAPLKLAGTRFFKMRKKLLFNLLDDENTGV